MLPVQRLSFRSPSHSINRATTCEDIDDDVLTGMLGVCDMETLLSFARVNKRFRAVALQKGVWLAQLRDLQRRGLLYPPPDANFENCTVTELIEELKRAVCGPTTWSSNNSPPIQPRRQIIIPFAEQHISSVRILPGGRYLAAESSTSIRVLDIGARRIAWAYQVPGRFLLQWSLDMRPGAYDAVIAVSHPGFLPGDWSIRIVSANFRTGESGYLFQLALPGKATILSILGDFVAVAYRGSSDGPGMLLVNWRTEQCVWLNAEFAKAQPILVPGHLVLTYESAARYGMHALLVCTILSLARLWVPITSMRLQDRVTESALTPLAHELLTFRGAPLMRLLNVQLRTQASPLRHDLYHITFYGTGWIQGPPPARWSLKGAVQTLKKGRPKEVRGAVLLSYDLDVSASAPASIWRHVSSLPATITIHNPISFARYTCHAEGSTPVVLHALSDRKLVLSPQVRGEGTPVDLAPYGGTVALLTDEYVIISYYT
ncbi:hypothetical protein C8R43DRAFT_1028205 [Mycena crocata]|nr:hypothetical protein C8R43DRAFT_1028205 [Mycena crocata]